MHLAEPYIHSRVHIAEPYIHWWVHRHLLEAMFCHADDGSKDPQKPAASLQLSQELVSEFGGIRALVAHFKAAPTSEACRNLLAVMLDYAIHQIAQASLCSFHNICGHVSFVLDQSAVCVSHGGSCRHNTVPE